MSDIRIDKIQQYGTAAGRAAFTPSPPSGIKTLYLWQDTDAELGLFYWDGAAWVQIGGRTLPLLTADPGSPVNDTFWVTRTGTTPTMVVAVKVRIGGATYTILSATL